MSLLQFRINALESDLALLKANIRLCTGLNVINKDLIDNLTKEALSISQKLDELYSMQN